MNQNPISASALIKKYHLNAKKSFGQNFIFDSNLTDKIAKSAGNLTNYHILEIGPGPTCLTQSILKQNPRKLIVVEKDQRFIPLLKEVQSFYADKLEIINDDALLINENKLITDKPFKIIANLPYNIGTALLFKWLKNCQNIDSMVIMLQKEVIERIIAKPGSKKYGRLAVMVNFLCNTKYLFEVNPASFTPLPQVTSALVKITPRPYPLMAVDIEILRKICAAVFGQRRKMLRSSLKSIIVNTESLLKQCNIDPTLRAEQLTLEQFGLLAKNYPNWL